VEGQSPTQHFLVWRQLKISERNLGRVLTFAKTKPLDPVMSRKSASGRPRKISMEARRMMNNKLQNPSPLQSS
jgi:hypothetical protein